MGILNRFKKKEEQKAVQKSAPSAALKAGSVASGVIRRPLVTEKSAQMASQGQYAFEVERHANKIQVRDAIRSMYGITPTSVNMLTQEGKKVRSGRTRGQRKGWKKAIVTLPKGKTIEVYEGV